MSRLDDFNATLDALVAQRLAVIQAGPAVSYEVHGHKFNWIEWMTMIGEQINVVRQHIAQEAPFEVVSRGR